MKLIIGKCELWIKDKSELPSNFDSMKDNEKRKYILNNKLLHREDGPATFNPTKCGIYQGWYLNGKKHRLNGPAEIWADGTKWYYLNDIGVYGKIYRKIQNCSKEKLLVYMIDSKYKDYLPLIEYRLNQ